jgi:hypothetical protein
MSNYDEEVDYGPSSSDEKDLVSGLQEGIESFDPRDSDSESGVQLLEEIAVAPVLPAVEVTALKSVRGGQKKGASKAVAKEVLGATAGLLASKVNTRLSSKRSASVVTAEKRKPPAKKVKAAQASAGMGSKAATGVADVAKGSAKSKNRLFRVGCIGPRAQDHLAQEDERGFVWSDEMAEGGDRGPSEGWTFPLPQEQVPTWDTKQEVFNITELFSIDKGTPTDSGAAAKRRAGGGLWSV